MRCEVIELKPFLDDLYEKFHTPESLGSDPLSFPRGYESPADIETVALISSGFAFGRVSLFMPVIEKILRRLGPAPADALMNAKKADLESFADSITYRFAKPSHVRALLALTGAALRENGSLEPLFMIGFSSGGTVDGLNSLAFGIRNALPGMNPGFLIPLPDRESPMKRLCMFLRWMVRDDGMDLGLWKRIKAADLLFPMDVHVSRISRLLGLLPESRNGSLSVRMKDAIHLTRSLSAIDPDDPVKYDFAISHLGISGTCRGLKTPSCASCPLGSVCINCVKISETIIR